MDLLYEVAAVYERAVDRMTVMPTKEKTAKLAKVYKLLSKAGKNSGDYIAEV